MIQGSSHAGNELAAQEFVILTVGAVISGKPCSWQQKPTSTRRMSSEMWQRCFVEGHFAPNILEKELAKHGSQVKAGQLPVTMWLSSRDDFTFLKGCKKIKISITLIPSAL